MGLRIDTVEQFRALLESLNFSVDSIDDLKRVLESVQEESNDPESRKEKQDHQERARQADLAHTEKLRALELEEERLVRQYKLAHQERLRTMQHQERFRAIELGQEDPGTLGKISSSAATLAGFVAMFMAVAAVFSTWLILRLDSTLDLKSTLWFVWGISGTVSLLIGPLLVLTARHRGPGRVAEPLIGREDGLRHSEHVQS